MSASKSATFHILTVGGNKKRFMYAFEDKYHFKNYIRKICSGIGLEKEHFENLYSNIFYNIYDFEKENFSTFYHITILTYVNKSHLNLRNLIVVIYITCFIYWIKIIQG